MNFFRLFKLKKRLTFNKLLLVSLFFTSGTCSSLFSMVGEIKFYDSSKPYYEFTNFYPAQINLDGKSWSTTERYFQTQKFLKGSPEKNEIENSPLTGFNFYKKVQDLAKQNPSSIDPNWHNKNGWTININGIGPVELNQKDFIMLTALFAKFTQNPNLKDLLLGTGNKTLIEDTASDPRRDDPYWGNKPYPNGTPGTNMLGKLLMYVRQEIKRREGSAHALGTGRNQTKSQNELITYILLAPKATAIYQGTIKPQYQRSQTEPIIRRDTIPGHFPVRTGYPTPAPVTTGYPTTTTTYSRPAPTVSPIPRTRPAPTISPIPEGRYTSPTQHKGTRVSPIPAEEIPLRQTRLKEVKREELIDWLIKKNLLHSKYQKQLDYPIFEIDETTETLLKQDGFEFNPYELYNIKGKFE